MPDLHRPLSSPSVSDDDNNNNNNSSSNTNSESNTISIPSTRTTNPNILRFDFSVVERYGQTHPLATSMYSYSLIANQ